MDHGEKLRFNFVTKMKGLISLLLLLIAFVAGKAVPDQTHDPSPNDLDHDSDFNTTAVKSLELYGYDEPATAVDGDDPWSLSVRRGAKLLQGMKASNKDAATLYNMGNSAESPYDGDLHTTLTSWGYNDNSPALAAHVDKECNMDSPSGHMLKNTFAELGMSTKPKSQGGPNECFQIEHYDSPSVILDDDGTRPDKIHQYYNSPCGSEFRITGAEHTVGINAESGAVYAMSIRSPAKAARTLWRRAPKEEELPHIRSFSDIAWAYWNRAAVDDLKNIKYFLVTMIINTETNQHVKQALQNLDPPKNEANGWPGAEFDMDNDAGKALLGSPVGRWAGYFLMQHKRQLGGSKWISKVRVFKSEKAGSLPYLLFYVEGPVETKSKAGGENRSERRNDSVYEGVVGSSHDGKSVVREHMYHARL